MARRPSLVGSLDGRLSKKSFWGGASAIYSYTLKPNISTFWISRQPGPNDVGWDTVEDSARRSERSFQMKPHDHET